MQSRLITRIAPDVGWMPISFANVYFIGRPGGKWILVDTGFPGGTREILAATEARFGSGSRPEAIVLTHGHIDHAGNAGALADEWDAPIYAHRLETPFLTGKSARPRFFPAFFLRFGAIWAVDCASCSPKKFRVPPVGNGWRRRDIRPDTFVCFANRTGSFSLATRC
jgi:glyoxylase-like metal-dependent hydrolase (beta-lactamase superfamily II)